MTTTTHREAPHHRNLTCYTDYRCRLPKCVDRYNTWDRERRRAINAGTWHNLLDAEPVRQHLLQLYAAGLTIHRVATLTGLTYASVHSFTHHSYDKGRRRQARRHRVTREVAAKILAVTLDSATPSRINAVGTHRRIQALVAIGWPLERIAPHAGLSPENMSTLLRRPRVNSSTAAAVADAYEKLRRIRTDHRPVDKTQAKKARNRAARNRWAPPAYWDKHPGAIDDPEFEPLYGVTRAEQIAQDAHWLISVGGLDRDQAAARLRVSRFSVDRALREHPQDDLEAAA